MEDAPTPASAILESSPGAPSSQPRRKKSQRRRRRKAACSANQKSASRPADPVTPDERWANSNSAFQRATRPRSTANDHPQMRSTSVKHPSSFHSSPLPQPPIPAAIQISGISSRLDHPGFSGLYKPAQSDPRQDSTATHSRVNSSGFGLSSPALQQPFTKPFSGLPSRHLMTSPHREVGEAEQERPGIVYPLLPRAAHPDPRVMIDAALPEAAALNRQSRPPTVLDITGTSLPESLPTAKSQAAKRQPRKRRRHRSTGLYRTQIKEP